MKLVSDILSAVSISIGKYFHTFSFFLGQHPRSHELSLSFLFYHCAVTVTQTVLEVSLIAVAVRPLQLAYPIANSLFKNPCEISVNHGTALLT